MRENNKVFVRRFLAHIFNNKKPQCSEYNLNPPNPFVSQTPKIFEIQKLQVNFEQKNKERETCKQRWRDTRIGR